MDRSTLENMAEQAAIAHNLPPSLVCAICQVESSWRPDATRFEPGYRYLFTPSKFPFTNEVIQQKTSTGLMQIMGGAARERGFQGDLQGLKDPANGLEYGCRHLSWFAARFLTAWGWPGVIRAWNTGRPQETANGLLYQAKIDLALNPVWP